MKNSEESKQLKPANGKAKLLIAAGFGNFLETFDFTVYSYFATIIGLVMLKTADPVFSTYISAIIFGMGFLARPIGSFALGTYADKHGRKAALLITIMLMGLGSACIAFAPPYAAIGAAAPIIVLIGRLLQGFSSGGEMGAASALLMESAGAKRRGFYVAWNFMTQGLSAAAGALCALCLFSLLSEEAMKTWGWRVPFFIALLIIPVGLYIRAHIRETYEPDAGQAARRPLQEIKRHYFGRFLLAIFTVMPVTLLVYSLVIYMPTYLSLAHIGQGGAAKLAAGSGRYVLTIVMSLVMMAATLCGGFICDRLARRKILAVSCLSLAFISVFATYYYVDKSLPLFLGGLFVSVIMLGMMMTVQALMVLEAFPRNVRATGFAVSLAFGSVLFGGTAQIVLTKLLMVFSGAPLAPFYYLGPMLLLAVAVYAAFKEERHP